MKRSIKEYLKKLSLEELDSLELEVLHASRDKSKNYFLKEIASEREYRSIKKVYDDIKNGTREDKCKFINTNPVDLLTIYKKHSKNELYYYLEKLSLEELFEIRNRLINDYKFLIKDPIIMEINRIIGVKENRVMSDKELELLLEKKEKEDSIKKTFPGTLLRYYYNQQLTDYLMTLSDEELERAERNIVSSDITGDNEKLYDVIRQEKEYRKARMVVKDKKGGKSI